MTTSVLGHFISILSLLLIKNKETYYYRDPRRTPLVSLPPVVSLLPPGLPSRTIAGTVSSELLGFCFILSLFFVSLPCARLSWPSRQLLSAR